MDPLTQALMMKQQMGQGQPPPQQGPSPMLQQLLGQQQGGPMGQGQSPQQQQGMGQPPISQPPVPQQAAPPQPLPVTPPNPPTRVPQQAKRFNNAQAIQNSIRNGWTPNPVLLRATLGNK